MTVWRSLMELAVVNQKFRKVEEARSPRVTEDSSMKNTQTGNTLARSREWSEERMRRVQEREVKPPSVTKDASTKKIWHSRPRLSRRLHPGWPHCQTRRSRQEERSTRDPQRGPFDGPAPNQGQRVRRHARRQSPLPQRCGAAPLRRGTS